MSQIPAFAHNPGHEPVRADGVALCGEVGAATVRGHAVAERGGQTLADGVDVARRVRLRLHDLTAVLRAVTRLLPQLLDLGAGRDVRPSHDGGAARRAEGQRHE